MLAGDTSVIVMNVSAMRPAVVVVGKFSRGLGRGGSSIASTLMTVAVGMRLPRLLFDGLLDEFDQGLGINSAAGKRLGIDSDSLGRGERAS